MTQRFDRLPGPPLTELSAVADLLRQNVTVGIRSQGIWSARNLRFDIGWVPLLHLFHQSSTDSASVADCDRSSWENLEGTGTGSLFVKPGEAPWDRQRYPGHGSNRRRRYTPVEWQGCGCPNTSSKPRTFFLMTVHVIALFFQHS